MPSNTGNIIQHYYSETPSATPSANNLYKGELALNINDGKLFYKDSSGVIQVLATKTTTNNSFENLAIQTNTILSTNLNGNIILEPNGTGDVQLNADTVRVGDAGAAATITTNGAGNLTISTNEGTNSGTIVIAQGSNANVDITPNGTGLTIIKNIRTTNQITSTLATGTSPFSVASNTVVTNLNADFVDGKSFGTFSAAGGILYASDTSTGAGTAAGTAGQAVISGGSGAPTFQTVASANGASTIVARDGNGDFAGRTGTFNTSVVTPLHTTSGTVDLTLSTNGGTNSGTISIANGVNGNITLTPNGTGDVLLSADTVVVGDAAAAATITTNGAGNLTLSTNSGTNSGTIGIAAGVNGNISFTPNGTGLTRTVNSGDAIFRAERTSATATTFDQIARNGYGELVTSTGRIRLDPSNQVVEVDGRLGVFAANPNALLHVVDTRIVNANYNANTVASINTTANTITFSATNSAITNGDMMFYTSSGTAITGLTSGFFYYARVINANTVQLHSNYSDTITAGVNPVNITGTLPAGTHTFKVGTELTQLQGTTGGNVNYLHTYQQRHTDGADWTGVSTIIQQRIDATPKAYIEFNPPSSTHGLLFGTGTVGIEAMRIDGSQRIGIGSIPFDGIGSLRASRNITGSTFGYGILSDGRVQTDVTNTAYYFRTTANTAIGAAPYTISNLVHYGAEQDTSFAANTTVTNQYGFFAGSSIVSATNDYGFYSNIAEGSARWNFYANGTANNYFGGSVVINTNNAFDGLRITQTGTGNALVVEDSANPDSTPFLIDGAGDVLFGTRTKFTTRRSTSEHVCSLQNNGTTTNSSSILISTFANNNTDTPGVFFAKSRNATVGSHTVVSSGDTLGTISFGGSDGTRISEAARITSEVDGSAASNDMPGRLVFLTTLDASNTPSERMRIDNAGNVNIGTFTTSISSRLTVVGQGNFTDASNTLRLRIGYGTVPGPGGTGAYVLNNDNSPLYLGANASASGLMVSTNNNVIIGSTTDSGAYKLQVVGAFAATTKSFLIDHPTKSGMKLRYASLEGPENGVYIRGRCKTGYINLPDYWVGLVDLDTITVDLTPVGKHQKIYVKDIQPEAVFVGNESDGPIDCFYTVYAERKDVDKLIVEFDGE